ncbi:MAG: NYN domain-containing protein [Fidelibacterota bacterium]
MIRYVIDGHNLMHAVGAYAEILERSYVRALEALYRDVDSYVHSRNVRAVLVFDGNPPGEPPEKTEALAVVFSGRGREADSVIARHIKKWPGPQTVVVTGDRGIRQTASSLRCQVASPEDFYRRVRPGKRSKSPKPAGPRAKSDGLAPHQIESWKKEMEQALARKKKDKS